MSHISTRRPQGCRLCRHNEPNWALPVLSLARQPLANALLPETSADIPERYPLELVRCGSCGHAQLPIDIPPGDLYARYRYRSGVNRAFRQHCLDLAREVLPMVERTHHEPRVLDIGCNDGTLLDAFLQCGVAVSHLHGVDVAPCAPAHFPVVQGEFPCGTLSAEYDVIVSLNTLNAVVDPVEVLRGMCALLAPRGVIILEVPYLVELIRRSQFDAVYHEHRSYWLVHTLKRALQDIGLSILAVTWVPTQGGSLRLVLGREESFPNAPGPTAWLWWEETTGFIDGRAYATVQYQVHTLRMEMARLLREHSWWGAFGAAAKATVLGCALDLGPKLVPWIADDTPEKQQHRIPWGASIVSPETIDWSTVPRIINFAWNARGEVAWRLKRLGFRGEVFHPFPLPRVERLDDVWPG